MYGTRTYPQILCFLGQLSFLAVVQLCQVSVQQISVDQRNPTSGHYQHQGAPCRPFLKEKSASGAYEEIFTQGVRYEGNFCDWISTQWVYLRTCHKDVRSVRNHEDGFCFGLEPCALLCVCSMVCFDGGTETQVHR